MRLPFDRAPDKVFGWFVAGSLLLLWLAILPVTLFINSRIVFGLVVLAWAVWLLLISVRLFRRGDKLIGWGILASFALFVLASFFTTRAIPLVYLTAIFVGWGTWRLLRVLPKVATIQTEA